MMSDTTDIVEQLRRRAHNGIQPMNELARLDMLAAAAEITRLRAALAQAGAPEGWQLVPVEPTEAMLYPDLETAGPGTQLGDTCADFGRQIWARMLAAAPTAQAGAKREPIGYMNEGHLHELQMGRLPYGYVYPSAGVGAETPIYTAHASPAQREPLSDAQIDSAPALTLADHSALVGRRELRQFARQIEAACAAAWGVKLADSGTTSGTKGAA